jgi:hypothetical protein
MSTIGQRIFAAGGEDKYLTLANEEYARVLDIGNNWTSLRVGVMLAFTPDGTNNLLSCTFALGVCSGLSATFGGSTSNFIGALVNNTTITYAAGPPPYFAVPTAIATKVNTTISATGATNRNHTTNTGSPQRRALLYVQLTKGSPNYTVDVIGIQTASALAIQLDYSYDRFIYGMEQPPSSVTLNGYALLYGTAATAFSESAGPLNTFNLFWNKLLFPVEIYAVAAYRFA